MDKLLYLAIAVILALTPHLAGAVQVSVHTLDNGMEVLIIPSRKSPAVTHAVFYRVGAIDERSGMSGAAHFLEHSMFLGTDKYIEGDISRMVAQVGGNNNAFTSQDVTAYYQTVPKDALEMCMEIESDRMRGLMFDRERIMKERDVVMEERYMRTENRPTGKLNEAMMAALFPAHPYGIPVIGWEDDISHLDELELERFYHRFYHPGNAFIVIAGDVDETSALTLANKHYGKLENSRSSDELQTLYPARRETLRNDIGISSFRYLVMHSDRAGIPRFWRFYRAPSMRTEHNAALSLMLLSQILGSGDSSILYRRLVIGEGGQKLADAAYSSYSPISYGDSAFKIMIVPKKGTDSGDAERIIREELAHISQDGVSEAELAHAKDRIKADIIYARDGVQHLAFIYGQAYSIGISPQTLTSLPDSIDLITNDDIKRAAKTYLTEPRSVTGALIP